MYAVTITQDNDGWLIKIKIKYDEIEFEHLISDIGGVTSEDWEKLLNRVPCHTNLLSFEEDCYVLKANQHFYFRNEDLGDYQHSTIKIRDPAFFDIFKQAVIKSGINK